MSRALTALGLAVALTLSTLSLLLAALPAIASAGTSKTAKPKASPVKVGCRVVGTTELVMTIKPRKRGTTLRKALGPKFGLGFTLPSGAASGGDLTVGFKAG